jgi:antirestriction protein ArdC
MKVEKILVDNLIKKIEETDNLTWTKTFGAFEPMNFASKRAYSGVNRIFTSVGQPTPYFLTLKQTKKLKGHVIDLKDFICIALMKFAKKLNGKWIDCQPSDKDATFVLRYYKVYNSSNIEGINFGNIGTFENSDKPNEVCEATVKATRANVIHSDIKSAFYSPFHDHVNIPPIGTHKSAKSYYSVLFHELIHWTGHKDRLNRFKDIIPSAFGSADYSEEELTAELGAAMLCAKHGILDDEVKTNSAAYLKSWLGILRKNPRHLIIAAQRAEKAKNFILK